MSRYKFIVKTDSGIKIKHKSNDPRELLTNILNEFDAIDFDLADVIDTIISLKSGLNIGDAICINGERYKVASALNNEAEKIKTAMGIIFIVPDKDKKEEIGSGYKQVYNDLDYFNFLSETEENKDIYFVNAVKSVCLLGKTIAITFVFKLETNDPLERRDAHIILYKKYKDSINK